MPAKTSDGSAAALAELQAELARLREKVAALEQAQARPAAAPAPAAPAAAPVSEETLAVLSAAVAAYLGKQARIKQVRLVSGEDWARQGRVKIFGSRARG